LSYISKKKHDRYFWFDANSIVLNGSTLLIKFGAKDVKYSEGAASENQSANAAYQIITKLVVTVLSRDEIKRITFSIDGERDNLPAVDPMKYQPYPRLIAKVLRHERQNRKSAKNYREFPPAALSRFGEFMNSRSPSFVLTYCTKDEFALGWLLECVNLMPWVETLVVAVSELPRYSKAIKQFILTNSFIRRIEIHGEGDVRLLAAPIRERSMGDRNPIEGLRFTALPADPRDFFKGLWGLGGCISRLNFSGALRRGMLDVLVWGLSAFPRLTHLSLDNCCPGLNLAKILEGLPDLRVLSLEKSSVEIGPILGCIADSDGMTDALRLNSLRVSWNPCSAPLRAGLEIPPSLAVIHADNIAWSGQNLLNFWKAFMRGQSHYAVKLSISNAQMGGDDWDHFFRRCVTGNCDFLTLLQWRNNPVAPQFFEQLSKCRRLEVLNLSGSVKQDDPAIPAMCRFLEEAPLLTHLYICGLEQRLSVDNIRQILTGGVQRNRSLQNLFICDHRTGPEIFSLLAPVMMANRRILGVALRGFKQAGGRETLANEDVVVLTHALQHLG
jgi:hypothetical protein